MVRVQVTSWSRPRRAAQPSHFKSATSTSIRSRSVPLWTPPVFPDPCASLPSRLRSVVPVHSIVPGIQAEPQPSTLLGETHIQILFGFSPRCHAENGLHLVPKRHKSIDHKLCFTFYTMVKTVCIIDIQNKVSPAGASVPENKIKSKDQFTDYVPVTGLRKLLLLLILKGGCFASTNTS